MSTDTSEETRERPPIPVLLGLRELVALFPVSPQTVYRWRVPRDGHDAALPEPELTVSRTPLWREEVILEFAEKRGHKLDAKALRKIREAQGHG